GAKPDLTETTLLQARVGPRWRRLTGDGQGPQQRETRKTTNALLACGCVQRAAALVNHDEEQRNTGQRAHDRKALAADANEQLAIVRAQRSHDERDGRPLRPPR